VKKSLIAIGVMALAAIGASAQNLNGAGATFPYPIYSKWFSEYNHLHPSVKINYQSIGSGGGIRQVSDGIVDFGASDGPMSDQQMATAKVRRSTSPLCWERSFLFTTFLGSIRI
jgi:phosphate transport system substrate-binding protein